MCTFKELERDGSCEGNDTHFAGLRPNTEHHVKVNPVSQAVGRRCLRLCHTDAMMHMTGSLQPAPSLGLITF